MTNPAKNAIEEAYSTVINPDHDYFAQLQPLARDGELANKITSNKVLFKLCMIVDQQEKEIKSLKDSVLENTRKLQFLTEAKDPTAPLGK